MLCPNCMSPYVKPFLPEDASVPDEPMLECTECDWVGPVTEFVPEIYR